MQMAKERSVDAGESLVQKKTAPQTADWFWKPWYAKALWALAGIYWLGLYAMMLAPAEWLSSSVAGAMILLIFLFNPITVVVILGRGFLKAKVACGDWIIIPGVSPELAELQRRERETAYLNPVDIRSGYLHQQYMERPMQHPTGRVDP
jgi:hypothetical protein